ncbi:hypothetical protein THAOC_29444 [Thalassiosira oceanica]|uniref:Uncharacterized protein n=1 Tax=Thalassiosira oceanica TaxID=159749 RepID=K0RGF1_THAOC|nr:hypothetical protein THAOC_29444 [Thalassiosira oceanica]|eukprot:EJK51384.1 hypothetical protein THAOC_29444 [Thalassiosira oceanica]
MMNCKVSIPSKERETYKSVFKALHRTLLGAGNKYLDAFMSVKDYIETKLKDKVWDVRLSITANASVEESIHRGRLNLPTQDEVAILFPDDITAQHQRNVILNYRAPVGSSLRRGNANSAPILFRFYRLRSSPPSLPRLPHNNLPSLNRLGQCRQLSVRISRGRTVFPPDPRAALLMPHNNAQASIDSSCQSV